MRFRNAPRTKYNLDRIVLEHRPVAMTAPHLTLHASRDVMATAVAHLIELALGAALDVRGQATLLCAGGSTPGPMYEVLSGAALDWANIHIGLTDERWVAPDDSASNAKLIRETLLQGHALAATFFPMADAGSPLAETASTVISDRYAPLVQASDIMVLGMGTDGHTLSWFPGGDGYDQAVSCAPRPATVPLVAPQTDVTGPHTERVTLTGHAVAQARAVHLLITGEAKRRVFETADPELPISRLIALAGDRLITHWAP